VRRDLEWLLNARLTADSVSDELPEVAKSLASYGLPDLTSANVHDPDGRDELRRAIEKAVIVFEPRLEGVEVELDRVVEGERSVRFGSRPASASSRPRSRLSSTRCSRSATASSG
jgi:type VI secretion system protein ImpF